MGQYFLDTQYKTAALLYNQNFTSHFFKLSYPNKYSILWDKQRTNRQMMHKTAALLKILTSIFFNHKLSNRYMRSIWILNIIRQTYQQTKWYIDKAAIKKKNLITVFVLPFKLPHHRIVEFNGCWWIHHRRFPASGGRRGVSRRILFWTTSNHLISKFLVL